MTDDQPTSAAPAWYWQEVGQIVRDHSHPASRQRWDAETLRRVMAAYAAAAPDTGERP